MTLIQLQRNKKELIFTYKISKNKLLWMQAQTIKENDFGELIPCDAEGGNTITHFIVELWINGDMLECLSCGEINKYFSIYHYKRMAK